MPTCRECGEPTRVAKIEGIDSKVTINPKPVASGTVRLNEKGFAVLVGPAWSQQITDDGEAVYQQHNATCSARPKWTPKGARA